MWDTGMGSEERPPLRPGKTDIDKFHNLWFNKKWNDIGAFIRLNRLYLLYRDGMDKALYDFEADGTGGHRLPVPGGAAWQENRNMATRALLP